MADKTFKKSVMIELNAKADAAERELEGYQRQLKETKWAEAELKAGTDKTKLAMVAQARKLAALTQKKKAAKAASRAHAKALAREKAAARDASGAFGKLGAQVGTATAAAGPYVAAAAAMVAVAVKLKGEFDKLVKAGNEWDGAVDGMIGQVRKLRAASGGMISDLALSRLEEHRKAMGWTQTETEAIANAAVEYSRINKGPVSESLKQVTDWIVNGGEELAKLGLTMDDNAGPKSAKQIRALEAITEKFGGMAAETTNAAEKAQKLANTQETLVGRLGQVIVTSGWYDERLESQQQRYSYLTAGVEAYTRGVADMSMEMVQRLRQILAASRPLIAIYDKISGTKMLDILNAYDVMAKDRIKTMRGEAAAEKEISAGIQKHVGMIRRLGNAEAERLRKLKKGGKAGVKEAKGSFDAHVELHRKHLAQKAKDMAAYRKKQKRMRWTAEKLEASHEAKFHKELAAANKKHAEAQIALAEKQRAKHEELAQAFLGTVGSALASAESGADALNKIAAAGINALGGLATKEAAFQFAKALAAAARWDAPGAALHTAAGVAFAALGIGAQAFAGQMSAGSFNADTSGAGGASSIGTGAASASSSGGPSGSGGSGGATVTNITTVHLRGRQGLLTRKDLRAFNRKLAQGRA